MSLRIIKRNPSGEDKEVILEIDPTQQGGSTDETFSVKGKIMDEKSVGIAGLTVRVYDKGLNSDILLGEQVSSSTGDYLIYYNSSQLGAGKLRADLLVKAYDTSGAEEVLKAESPIIVSALKHETIDLVSDQAEFIGPSEYTQLSEKLNPLLTGADITLMDLQGVAMLAAKLEIDAVHVGDFLKARVLAGQLTVSEEVLYGLMRYDLPYEASDLLRTSDTIKREAIEAMADSNIINPALADDIDSILATFNQAVVNDALTDEEDSAGESEFAKLLNIVPLDAAKQAAFYEAYLASGENETFWEDIVTAGTLTATERDNTKFVLQLSVIAQGHLPMVSSLYADAAIQSVQDLGKLAEADWLLRIDDGVGGGTGVPNIDPADVTQEDKNEYAEALLRAVEEAFPTKVLKTSIDSDPDYTGTEIKQFVQDNQEYDFKDTSPRKYLKDNPTALDNATDPEQAKEEIFRTKRLLHIAKGNNKSQMIKTLNNNNLDSASKIVSKGRRSFTKKYAATLGDEATAQKVYKTAVKRTAASVMLHAAFNPSLNNVSTRVFSASLLKKEDTTANPELEVFFGSQDYCNCTHCRSSLSPAAYLVDLLAFLKEAENTANVQTAWEQLQVRRPELKKIDLSCDNTNTPMPYIDLVNEVLEYAISGGNVDRQTTRDEKSLKTEPEHLNKAAYDLLAQQVYPWSLPLHLWNEEARVYLKKLDINRSKIVRTLEGQIDQPTGMSLNEAVVYLGISVKELEALTDTSTVEYYDVSQTSTLQPVSVLLEKTGLKYSELLELLEMKFVNPADKKIVFTPLSSCSVDDATLDFVLDEYNKMHRFVRLQHLLGWPARVLDMAITALGESNISETLITKIAGVKKLQDRFNLKPEEVLTWYALLSGIVYDKKQSQYDSVFLNPVYNSDATVQAAYTNADITPIELVTATGELNTTYSPVAIGALRLKAPDLLKLMNEELASTTANKAQLSHLYRIASLVRTLKISVQDYLDLKSLTGLQAFSSASTTRTPNDTLIFLNRYDLIRRAEFSIEELNYSLRHVVSPKIPYSTESKMSALLTNLRKRLQEELQEKGISTTRTREDVLNMFLLFFEETNAVKSLEITEDGSVSGASAFIDDYWTGLVADTTDAKNKLVVSGGSLATPQERYDYVLQAFYTKLVEIFALKGEVSQFFADNLEYSEKLIATLLEDELKDPGNVVNPAITLFTSYDFVFSDTEILNDATYQNYFSSLRQLHKILLVAGKLNIKSDRIAFVLNETATTGWYNLKSLPQAYVATVPNADFASFIRLLQAFLLERDYATAEGFSIIQLIENAISGVAPATLQQQLSDGTDWHLQDIEFLAGANGFNFQTADYNNEGWLVKLDSSFFLLNLLRVSAGQLASWKAQDVTYEQAQAIKLSVKSNYDLSSWYKVASDLRDELRKLQRDALSAYLIATNPDFKDTNDLYSYYLLDTEMAPCAISSRVKLAISTVQLWVQRIRMDLESGINFTDEDLDEWKWRKNYRVWEAARKVFLYPENWIEPELRDDKTPFFRELEDELLQDEVNEETAERAYLHYLHKLDQVANLEIAGTYQEDDRKILHVFARTKNAPHLYFYRKWEDGFRWGPWEKVELDIEADHLVPVVFNRRIMLFWPIMNEKPVEVKEKDLEVKTSNGQITQDVKNKVPLKKVEVQMAYSEWSNNKWQPKRLSVSKLITSGATPENYFFKTTIDSKGLSVDTFYHESKENDYEHQGSFFLDNCTGKLEVSRSKVTTSPSAFAVSNAYRSYMKILEETGSNSFEITETLSFDKKTLLFVDEKFRVHKRKILGKTPGQFLITYPVTESEILSSKPFFYEDNKRVFFVVPSERTFQKSILVQLRPLLIKKIIEKPVKKPVPVQKPTPPVKKYVPPIYTAPARPVNSGGAGINRSFKEISRLDFQRLPKR